MAVSAWEPPPMPPWLPADATPIPSPVYQGIKAENKNRTEGKAKVFGAGGITH